MIEALIFAGGPAAAQASEPCAPRVAGAAAVWWFEPLERPPGATISLAASWTDRPGAFQAVPQGCVTDVKVSPAGLATLGADGASLIVADDAPSGTLIAITGRVADKTLEAQVRVVAPADAPLSGTWRQASSSCAGGTPVRELIFRAEGRFYLTWTPFESYRDYWGRYSLDPETGAFSAEIEGGNRRPANLDLAGAASLEGDNLVLDDVWLGDPTRMSAEAQRCAYRFVRAGVAD
ncbi:MAG: hypothetical protein EOP17_00955 [Rhizobiaceae bacterium]|nr:MAG: hypothetical protein EOP17_00955 [Rhizobiaceae bacterium]